MLAHRRHGRPSNLTIPGLRSMPDRGLAAKVNSDDLVFGAPWIQKYMPFKELSLSFSINFAMRNLILALLVLLSLTAFSQKFRLSPEAEISIITCGPWQGEVYSAFGHNAIRVYDPVNRIDDAYNYGVFDFNQPNFYLNYTRGLLLFKLGVYPYPDFRNIYIYYNRSVTEQVLNLSDLQKQAVYDFLEWNARPENETYRYDYFYNNCATQVRDVFVKVLQDSIHF